MAAAWEGYIAGGDVTFIAGESLTTKQYYFVKLSADNTVVLCSGATDVPIGVLQNKPASGQTARVRMLGISRVVSSGNIGFGVAIGTDANGKAVAKTTNKDIAPGIVLQGATQDGEVLTASICTFSKNNMSL